MTTLWQIYTLLVKEYRISHDIIGVDKLSGKLVNEVTEVLYLVVNTSHDCKRGALSNLEQLVKHRIRRNMPPERLIAIDCYLRERRPLSPLPLIRLIETISKVAKYQRSTFRSDQHSTH